MLTSPQTQAAEPPPDAIQAAHRPTDTTARRRARVMAAWLLVCCVLVGAMVILGGLTRLTNSGLSMVDWKPITGWLPPMDEAGWQRAFDAYKQYPEYQKINYGMSLDEFKGIFWLEFLHRLLGRVIGVAFFLPFAFFAMRRWLDRRLTVHFVAMLALGGLQGLIGWYMVKSGLVERPDVSQYRLALHLMMAFAVYAYMLWFALELLSPRAPEARDLAPRRVRWAGRGLLAWATLTITSGAFVAGLDAGMDFNTFPLMEGAIAPAGMFELDPAIRNVFENHTTVQFSHRTLAELLFVGVLAFWVLARKAPIHRNTRRAAHAVLLTACVQVGLGIATLLLVVPVWAASLHQAGALAVFTTLIYAVHTLGSGPPAARA